MMLCAMTRLTASRVVLCAFVVLGIAPFARAALHPWFWQSQHSMAPVATALYLAVVLALVAWRRRWSWLLLVLLYGSGAATWAFDPHRFAVSHLLRFVVGGLTLALLLSAPMRQRLRPPVFGRSASSQQTNAG
jgi:hypothetical protein